MKDFLASNPQVAGEIEAAVRENVDKLFKKPGAKAAAAAASARAAEEPPVPAAPPPASEPDLSLDITVDD